MKDPTHSVSLSEQERIELEMLHAVLLDELAYPWNPAHSTAAAYLDNREVAFEPGDLPEDIFTSQWSHLSQQAERLWSGRLASLASSLTQQFGSRVPSQVLTQLATAAETASENSQALIDQLVICVQDVLGGWDADDLRVMARPLAMAMRDGQGEILDLTLRSIRQTDWENLSEIEQARLSLAIARYALGELAAQGEGE